MIYRCAMPEDGQAMLRLMEAHPASGGMQILLTRRPDAYQSYCSENPDVETMLCVDDGKQILAQIVCLPRKLYIGREVQRVGYLTGLHKEEGARVNLMKMLDTGHYQSSLSHFFCAMLDSNRSAYDVFAKRGLIHPMCAYSTYLLHPASPKRMKSGYAFRRATPGDEESLLAFYREVGSGYAYYPAFGSMEDYAGLSLSDFYLLEDGRGLVAAGALWNQQAYKQYVSLGYHGVYRLAARCNPLLRLLRYPPLPPVGSGANFAYLSFLLCREECQDAACVLLGELAHVGSSFDFLAIGVVQGEPLGEVLDMTKSIRIGSKLCLVDYARTASLPSYAEPYRFECALL